MRACRAYEYGPVFKSVVEAVALGNGGSHGGNDGMHHVLGVAVQPRREPFGRVSKNGVNKPKNGVNKGTFKVLPKQKEVIVKEKTARDVPNKGGVDDKEN
eukprot:37022-Hanusia_phi.AAC.1